MTDITPTILLILAYLNCCGAVALMKNSFEVYGASNVSLNYQHHNATFNHSFVKIHIREAFPQLIFPNESISNSTTLFAKRTETSVNIPKVATTTQTSTKNSINNGNNNGNSNNNNNNNNNYSNSNGQQVTKTIYTGWAWPTDLNEPQAVGVNGIVTYTPPVSRSERKHNDFLNGMIVVIAIIINSLA